MINLHESMGPGRDRTRNPWICSQIHICCQTCYRLPYAAQTADMGLRFLSRPFSITLVDLYQVYSNNAHGVKNDPPRGSHVLLRLIYRENMKKSSWPRVLIFGICSIISWTSTEFVQIIPLGPKMGPPQGVTCST